MPIEDFHPIFLSEQDSKEIATRQLLSFLRLADEEPRGSGGKRDKAPSKELFAFNKIPINGFTEARHLLNWRTRPIYDVDGRLLFRDHTLEIDNTNNLHVRITASDLLRTPVWLVRAGPTWNIDGLISKAVIAIKATPDLEPVLVGHEIMPRLICYGYPHLGILCFSRTRPDLKFVVDLWDLTFIPLGLEEYSPPESVTIVWSPYDMINRGTVALFRSLWKRRVAFLPELPNDVKCLQCAISAARQTVDEELTTDPELVRTGQLTNEYCAPATAQMIFSHHNIFMTQRAIARRMQTSNQGTLPDVQANAIAVITNNALVGSLDDTASFGEGKTEILENRPFKTGGVDHARACGGFRIDTDGTRLLYIYDPLPANQGSIYFEPWLANYHCNYMYVNPPDPQ